MALVPPCVSEHEDTESKKVHTSCDDSGAYVDKRM